MIDSANPKALYNGNHSIIQYEPNFDGHTQPKTKTLIKQSVAHLKDLIRSWELPLWNLGDMPTAAESFSCDEQKKSLRDPGAGLVPPPTILLRARQYVFDKNNKNSARTIYDIDIARHEARLGWEYYKTVFINQVFEIPGHHYNIFDNDKV
jgi:hypothetical protein